MADSSGSPLYPDVGTGLSDPGGGPSADCRTNRRLAEDWHSFKGVLKFIGFAFILIPFIFIGVYFHLTRWHKQLPGCSNGFLLYRNSKCFLIVKGSVSYENAHSLCRTQYGASLLKLSNLREAELLWDLAHAYYGVDSHIWVRDGGGSGGCRVLSKDGVKVLSHACDARLSFACETVLNVRSAEDSDESAEKTISAMQEALVATREQVAACGSNESIGITSRKRCTSGDNYDSLCPPIVTKDPSSGKLVVAEKLPFSLGCKAEGNPVPVVEWSLPNKSKMLAERLEVAQATTSQSGIYVCRASNGAGLDVYEEFAVQVVFKPRVKVKREEELSENLHRVTLKCTVESSPKAKILWIQKESGKASEADDGRQIGLNTVETALKFEFNKGPIEGTAYSCLAVNEYGVTQSNTLPVGLPPSDVSVDKGVQVDSSRLMITVIGSSQFGITEFKIEFKSASERHWDEMIVAAKPNNESSLRYTGIAYVPVPSNNLYKTRASARNSFGWSQPSPVADFYGKSDQWRTMPQNVLTFLTCSFYFFMFLRA